LLYYFILHSTGTLFICLPLGAASVSSKFSSLSVMLVK